MMATRISSAADIGPRDAALTLAHVKAEAYAEVWATDDGMQKDHPLADCLAVLASAIDSCTAAADGAHDEADALARDAEWHFNLTFSTTC